MIPNIIRTVYAYITYNISIDLDLHHQHLPVIFLLGFVRHNHKGHWSIFSITRAIHFTPFRYHSCDQMARKRVCFPSNVVFSVMLFNRARDINTSANTNSLICNYYNEIRPIRMSRGSDGLRLNTDSVTADRPPTPVV